MTDFTNPKQTITDRGIAEGDMVRTGYGAAFRGVCLVIYMSRVRKELHADVEALDPAFAGTIHVYPLKQLVLDTDASLVP